jgi:hypothetical protein
MLSVVLDRRDPVPLSQPRRDPRRNGEDDVTGGLEPLDQHPSARSIEPSEEGDVEAVDEYLRATPEPQRTTLLALRAT